MGRTLDQIIASSPNEEQERIEKRYQELRRDHLETQGDNPVIEIRAEERDDDRPEPQAN